MIKLEFPADRKDIAEAFGRALLDLAGVATAKINIYNGSRPDVLNDEDLDFASLDKKPEDAPVAPPSLFDKPAEAPQGERRDTNGVEFDAKFCANAAEPFYASGKRQGQWKKRKNVDDSDYDVWYASQLQSEDDGTGTETPVDTSAAFGAPAAQAEISTPAELFKWISERQADGSTTEGAVNAAFNAVGVTTATLFTCSPADQAAYVTALVEALRA